MSLLTSKYFLNGFVASKEPIVFKDLLESLKAVDWQQYLSHVTNDKIVEFFTSVYGLATLGGLLAISLICKWRIFTALILGGIGVCLVAKFTLSEEIMGPDKSVLLFAGGGVVVGAFLIYFLFIQDD